MAHDFKWKELAYFSYQKKFSQPIYSYIISMICAFVSHRINGTVIILMSLCLAVIVSRTLGLNNSKKNVIYINIFYCLLNKRPCITTFQLVCFLCCWIDDKFLCESVVSSGKIVYIYICHWTRGAAQQPSVAAMTTRKHTPWPWRHCTVAVTYCGWCSSSFFFCFSFF